VIWLEIVRAARELTWLEIAGDLTGLLCVWLLARQNIWTWPIGIVNNILFIALFWRAKLYADASLQVVFAALAAYGWYLWLRVTAPGVFLPIRRTTAREWVLLSVFVVLGQGAVYWGLSRHTDSPVPFWDAAVWALSLAATYGQARKLFESWLIWIVVDVISVPLYIGRGLYLTALLYFLFLCLCVKGYLDWRAALQAPPVPHAVPA
jgi:nicotinamide mononucleotide transporter